MQNLTHWLLETPPGEWHEVHNSRQSGSEQFHCVLLGEFHRFFFFFFKEGRSYREFFRGRDSDLCNFPTWGGKSRWAPKCITQQPLVTYHMHGKNVRRPFGKPVPADIERNSGHPTSPQQTKELNVVNSPETCTMQRGSSVLRSEQLNFLCTLCCQVETYSKAATISVCKDACTQTCTKICIWI